MSETTAATINTENTQIAQSVETYPALFTAAYRGTCPTCNGAILPGTNVVKPRKGGQRIHEACFDGVVLRDATDDSVTTTTTVTAHVAKVTQIAETGNGAAAAMAALAQALSPMISAPAQQLDAEQVRAMVLETVSADFEARLERIAKAIEPAVRKAAFEEAQKAGIRTIEIENKDVGVKVQIDTPHHLFERLLYITNLRDGSGYRTHSYLWGPAGSGKSTAASQIAKALGLSYGYVSLDPQAARSVLMGYMDVNGKYVRTPFRDCYENGGVFCIDEADNGSANLMVALNAALENGHCAFPDGLVARHPDFVVIATGNTAGRGGDPRYASRRAFDAAFADRFVFLQWGYDEAMESKVAKAINANCDAWVTWVRKVRAMVESQKIDRVVSPRATFRGAKMLADGVLTVAEIAEMVVFRGLEAGTRDKILSAHPLPRS